MPRLTTSKALAIFGLPVNFSREDLGRAYRRLALANHPDHKRPEEQEQAHGRMAEINEAHDHLAKVLRDTANEQAEAQTAPSTSTPNPRPPTHPRSRSPSPHLHSSPEPNPVELSAATFDITSEVVSKLLTKVSKLGRDSWYHETALAWSITLHEDIAKLDSSAGEADKEWSKLRKIQRAGEWKKNRHLATDTLRRLQLLRTTCRRLDRWADTAARELQAKLDEAEFAPETDGWYDQAPA
jgi:hypothetical protein